MSRFDRRSYWLLVAVGLVLVALPFWWSGDPRPEPARSGPSAEITATVVRTVAPAGEGVRRVEVTSTVAARADASSTAPGFTGRLLQDGRPLADTEVTAIHCWRHEQMACTRTDAHGWFQLQLPAAGYRLDFAGAAIPHGFHFDHVALQTDQQRDLGDLHIPLGAVISGRVVDEQGQPLGGVRVHGRSARSGDHFRLEVVDPAAPEADPSALTDADGRFRIGNLWPGKLCARAEAIDYQSWEAEVEVEPGTLGDTGQIVLRRAEALSGHVVDEHGAPIAGVRVTPGGGRISPLHLRQAVVTGPGGDFILRGFGNQSEVCIEKDGFETVACTYPAVSEPLRVVLRKALELIGRVSGTAGHAGTLVVDSDPESHVRPPDWVCGILATQRAIGPDGSFRVTGLPEGKWRVRATFPDLGSVAPVTCELPQEAPLQLVLVADSQIAVSVVDDLGAAVPHATLVRAPVTELSIYGDPKLSAQAWLDWPTRMEKVADAGGKAVIGVPPHEPLQLAAIAPGHLLGAEVHGVGSVPRELTVVVPRGGGLRGSIADASITAHVRVFVTCARTEKPDQPVCQMPVDNRGNFCSRLLLPGSYRVSLLLVDAWDERSVPPCAPVPLLASYAPVMAVPAEVVAGSQTVVQFPAFRCGEIRGRVLAGGIPVASAIVFGHRPGEKPSEDSDSWTSDAFRWQPHCITDGAGRFRFLVSSADTFHLRVRHQDGAVWSAPVAVQLTPGEQVQRDLLLQAAAIRGSFDVSQIPLVDREFFTAQLYRLEDASMDPFWDLGAFNVIKTVPSHHAKKLALGKTSTFAFECLPPGGYVLRLVTRDNGILLQRVLHTTGDEELALGCLEVPVRVLPQLACGLSPAHGIYVRQAVAGTDGVFVRKVRRNRDGALAWEALVPGRYRLQAFEIGTWDIEGGGDGDPSGAIADVEVHPDGSCTPAIVWPDGVVK